MEKLINSIKLISFNYMYSSNKTLDGFGIEYSYIASAMNSMLKSTNNGIKDISIGESNGIIIDANWWCAVSAIASLLRGVQQYFLHLKVEVYHFILDI